MEGGVAEGRLAGAVGRTAPALDARAVGNAAGAGVGLAAARLEVEAGAAGAEAAAAVAVHHVAVIAGLARGQEAVAAEGGRAGCAGAGGVADRAGGLTVGAGLGRLVAVVAALGAVHDAVAADLRDARGVLAVAVADRADGVAVGAVVGDGVAVVALLLRRVGGAVAAEARRTGHLVAGEVADGAGGRAVGAGLGGEVAVVAALVGGVDGGVAAARDGTGHQLAEAVADGAGGLAVGAGLGHRVALIALLRSVEAPVAALGAAEAGLTGEGRAAIGSRGAGGAEAAALGALVDDAVAVVVQAVAELRHIGDHAAGEGEVAARAVEEPVAGRAVGAAEGLQGGVGPGAEAAGGADHLVAVGDREATGGDQRIDLGEEVGEGPRVEGADGDIAAEGGRAGRRGAGIVEAGVVGDQLERVGGAGAGDAILNDVQGAEALGSAAEALIGDLTGSQHVDGELTGRAVHGTTELANGGQVGGHACGAYGGGGIGAVERTLDLLLKICVGLGTGRGHGGQQSDRNQTLAREMHENLRARYEGGGNGSPYPYTRVSVVNQTIHIQRYTNLLDSGYRPCLSKNAGVFASDHLEELGEVYRRYQHRSPSKRRAARRRTPPNRSPRPCNISTGRVIPRHLSDRPPRSTRPSPHLRLCLDSPTGPE